VGINTTKACKAFRASGNGFISSLKYLYNNGVFDALGVLLFAFSFIAFLVLKSDDS